MLNYSDDHAPAMPVYMKVFVNQTATFMLCCGQPEVKNQVCPWQFYMKVLTNDCNHRLSKFVVADENDHAPAMPVI